MKVKIRVEQGDGEVIEVDGTSVVFYLAQDDKEALSGLYGEFPLGGLLQAADDILDVAEKIVNNIEKIVNNIAGDIAESIIK